MKLVSLILPCYNHEKYISDCLNSLCDQTYENIEIFITDDCSRDGSFALLESWKERLEQRFCKVSICKNPENMGVVKTLNNMLTQCRGEYIKILATDDMLLPDAIENMVKFAEDTDCDIGVCNVYRFDEAMHYPVTELHTLEKNYTTPPQLGGNLTGALLAKSFICAPGVIIPKRTFEKYGLFDPAYIMEDTEYWLRVSVDGKFCYLDQCVALYRVNHNSLSHFSLDEAQLRRHRVFFEQILTIFTKYEHHASQEQKAVFFNHELGTTIGLGDKALTKEILSSMKERHLPVSVWNRFRAVLLQMDVYLFLKKCKHLLKHR